MPLFFFACSKVFLMYSPKTTKLPQCVTSFKIDIWHVKIHSATYLEAESSDYFPQLLICCEQIGVTQTHLFVSLGRFHTHAERLGPLVSLWTGQAVETWICVDAALCSTDFVANIRHHVTLEEEENEFNTWKTAVHTREMTFPSPH